MDHREDHMPLKDIIRGREWIIQIVTIIGALFAILTVAKEELKYTNNKFEQAREKHMEVHHAPLYKPQFPGDSVNRQLIEIRKETVKLITETLKDKSNEIEKRTDMLSTKIEGLIIIVQELKEGMAELKTELRMSGKGAD